jgi:hypothetical protein
LISEEVSKRRRLISEEVSKRRRLISEEVSKRRRLISEEVSKRRRLIFEEVSKRRRLTLNGLVGGSARFELQRSVENSGGHFNDDSTPFKYHANTQAQTNNCADFSSSFLF